MSEIALYDTLRKIEGVSAAEAKEAVDDIANARDVATKADIKDMATKADVERMGRIMVMWVVGVGMAVAAIVLAAVGILVRFL